MPERTERLRVASGSPFEPLIGFSRAVRAGDRVLVSGTAPIWPDGSCDPDPEVQAARCLEIVVGALAEAGAGPEDVVHGGGRGPARPALAGRDRGRGGGARPVGDSPGSS